MAGIKRWIGVLGLSLAALGWSNAAQAQEKTGFEIGGRIGYGIPLGKATGDATEDMNKGISGQVPLWLDIGGRVTPHIMIGAGLQYGFGILPSDVSDSCNANNLDCSTHVIRIGPEIAYHISPFEKTDPWIGGGMGYEWWTLSQSGSGNELSVTARGIEFVNFQAGVDFAVGDSVGLGPFLSFSMGQYDHIDCSGAGCGLTGSFSGSIDNKSLHEWFVFGFRVTAVP